MWMADAPAQFVLTAAYGRITSKYGERGVRYALMEAGHIAQNIMLQCQSIGLAAGIVGAFHDREVARVLGIGEEDTPLLILPVGCRR
jgi:SagB-type dehydrogenase family enzyme